MRSPCTATKSSPRSVQLEKARTQQQRPNAAKNFLKINNKNKLIKKITFAFPWQDPLKKTKQADIFIDQHI